MFWKNISLCVGFSNRQKLFETTQLEIISHTNILNYVHAKIGFKLTYPSLLQITMM
jgi:hypothetical protein